jgi:hypothetical protein
VQHWYCRLWSSRAGLPVVCAVWKLFCVKFVYRLSLYTTSHADFRWLLYLSPTHRMLNVYIAWLLRYCPYSKNVTFFKVLLVKKIRISYANMLAQSSWCRVRRSGNSQGKYVWYFLTLVDCAVHTFCGLYRRDVRVKFRKNACNETNLMYYLSSVYSVTLPVHVTKHLLHIYIVTSWWWATR